MRLDLLLGVLDRARHPRMLDDLVLLHPQPLHHGLDLAAGENTHQAVFKRQVEAAGAGVALAPRTPTQLVVHAPRLVALGADDAQAAGLDNLAVAPLPVGAGVVMLAFAGIGGFGVERAAQHDVGAAPRHVGGDGHRARTPGLRDDAGLGLVVLGVQHLVGDFVFVQHARQVFRNLNRGGAHQHRLAALDAVADVGDDGVELLVAGHIDEVGLVVAHHRVVGRDDDDLKAVDVLKLKCLGVGGAGHAGEFLVEPEVILEGDGRQRLVLLLDAHALLGLDRLVQAVRPAPPRHHAPGELVYNQHAAVADDVVHILPEQRVRAQRRADMVKQADVGGAVEAALVQQPLLLQHFLDALVAVLGQHRLARLLVYRVIALAVLVGGGAQAAHHAVYLLIDIGAALGRPGDNQRRARLVNQD